MLKVNGVNLYTIPNHDVDVALTFSIYLVKLKFMYPQKILFITVLNQEKFDETLAKTKRKKQRTRTSRVVKRSGKKHVRQPVKTSEEKDGSFSKSIGTRSYEKLETEEVKKKEMNCDLLSFSIVQEKPYSVECMKIKAETKNDVNLCANVGNNSAKSKNVAMAIDSDQAPSCIVIGNTMLIFYSQVFVLSYVTPNKLKDSKPEITTTSSNVRELTKEEDGGLVIVCDSVSSRGFNLQDSLPPGACLLTGKIV
jgi:hypothetical protein